MGGLPLSQSPIIRYLLKGGGAGGYAYVPSGDASGITDTPVIKAYLESGDTRPLAPGKYYLLKTALAGADYKLPAFTIRAKSGVRVMQGVEFCLVWSPALDASANGEANASLGVWCDWQECDGYGWEGLKITMSPDPTSEGIVTAIDNATNQVTVKCLPGRAPVWTWMGAFGIVPGPVGVVPDPTNSGFVDWQHTTELDTNDPLYRILPSDLGPDYRVVQVPRPVSAITSIVLRSGNGNKYARITVPAGSGFTGGMTVSLAGVTGMTSGGVSVLDGVLFKLNRILAEEDDGSGPMVFDLQITNQGSLYPFPSNTTDGTGGTLTAELRRDILVGTLLALSIGKKRGRLLTWMFNKRPTLRITFEQCTGIGVYGKGNSDWTITPRAVGNGLIAINHGTILLADSRGTCRVPEYYVKGCGDAHIAGFVYAIQAPRLNGSTANTLSVTSWASRTIMNAAPSQPQVGDRYGYFRPDGAFDPVVNRVLSSTTNSVTFDGNHPAGFDLTMGWKVVPLDLNPKFVGGTIHMDGGWTVGATIFFRDIDIDYLQADNIAGEGARFSIPGTLFRSLLMGLHPDGAVTIGDLVVTRCGYRTQSYRKAAVAAVRRGSDDLPSSAGTRPVLNIGRLTIDHYGFCALSAAGWDIRVGTLTLLHGGEFRANAANGVYARSVSIDSMNDLYTEQGSISVGTITGSLPTLYVATGGSYSGPAAPTNGSTYPSNTGGGSPGV